MSVDGGPASAAVESQLMVYRTIGGVGLGNEDLLVSSGVVLTGKGERGRVSLLSVWEEQEERGNGYDPSPV